MFKFNLGDEVKCQITGYKGYVRSRGDYLTGCNRYGIGQKMKKDGTLPDWKWFDEQQLKLVKANAIKLPEEEKPKKKSKPGGPLPNNQLPIK